MMWPFRKKEAPKKTPPKHGWQDEKYGFSEYEKQVLLKVEEIFIRGYWCRGTPSNKFIHCPYCNGPVVELYNEKNSGFLLRLSMGLFCLRCGAELVCAVKGCRYKLGDVLIGNDAHWGCEGVGNVQYKIRRNGRNLRDIIIARLEEQKHLEPKLTGGLLRPPEPEDEYAALDKRLDEIAEKERQLEEDRDKIKKRMWEIDFAIAQGLLEEIEPEPSLLQAANGDREIVAEAEAEVDALTTADKI